MSLVILKHQSQIRDSEFLSHRKISKNLQRTWVCYHTQEKSFYCYCIVMFLCVVFCVIFQWSGGPAPVRTVELWGSRAMFSVKYPKPQHEPKASGNCLLGTG